MAGEGQKRFLRAERDRKLVVEAVRQQRIAYEVGLKLLLSSGLSRAQATKLL